MSLFLYNMYGNKLVVKTYTYVKKRNYFAFIQKFRPEVFYKRDVSEHFRSSRPVRLRPATLSKMRLWHRCFPMNFAKFLRTPFFIEHLQWLLLICVQLLLFITCQMNKRGVSVSCFLKKGFLIFKISQQQGQTW